MILNLSRAALFQECRRKLKNWHELGLVSHREADPLMWGEAFHKGAACLSIGIPADEAAARTEEIYRKRLEGQMILPEELPMIERMIEQAKHAVRVYAENSPKDIEVLQPEVEFMVPLPNTIHHCLFAHRILYPDVPYNECLVSNNPPCYIPHYLKGRTDAVIKWNKMIWLREYKTTAITGNMFFIQWLLHMQPTGYIYGIWKSTGLRPHGFLMEIVKKPNKRAADQFAFGFEREPYLRSDEDLARFEKEIIEIASDLERAVIEDRMYMNPKSCTNYNRTCYYHDFCKRNFKTIEGEFRKREPDYVDKEYLKILGLEEQNA